MSNKSKITVAAVAAAVFAVMLCLVLTDKAYIIDDPIRNFFYGLRADWLTPVSEAITHLGSTIVTVIICGLLLVIKPVTLKIGVPLSAGAILTTLVNRAIKHLVQRARPDEALHLVHAGGFSFPSGHSITSMFVFGMLIYLVRRNVKNKTAANILTAVLAVPMITVGLSRIYLGVHYPTDVIAGWSLAVIFIMSIAAVYEKFYSKQDTL